MVNSQYIEFSFKLKSFKGEYRNKLAKLSSKRFLTATANNKLRGKNLCMEAKTKENFKPELYIKVV